MAKNIRGKRPCSICRKWFQPIAQQKGRQRTCSPACQHELHRRQCEQWNRKHKEYFKSNYLADKIQAIDEQESSRDPPQTRPENPPASRIPCLTEPILPMDVIVTHMGKKYAVIIQYLVFQITRYVHSGPFGYT
jgi:hypothetical protein